MNKDILPKHRDVFIYFSEYSKRHKWEVKHTNKSYIYRKVGDPFYLDPPTAARIIYTLLRKGYTPSQIDIEEFKERFKDLKEML